MQLDKLTDLAAAAPEPSRFYRELVATLRELTPARAVAVWNVVGERYRLEASDGLRELDIDHDQSLQTLHENALSAVCRQSVSASATSSTNGEVSSTSLYEHRTKDALFSFFACHSQDELVLVIELVLMPADSAQSPQRLLSAVEEIVRDYSKSLRIREYEHRLTNWDDHESVVQRIHAARSLDKLSYEIVNEVRRYLDCDRVVLVRVRDGHCQTLAVSAVATLDPRSQQLRSLEQLTANVLRTETHWQYPHTREEPPQRADILHEYLDHSGCQTLWIECLPETVAADLSGKLENWSESNTKQKPKPLGGLIVENFDQSVEPSHQQSRLHALLPHVQIAFARAVHFDQLPLLKLSYALQSWTSRVQQRGLRWLLAAALLGVTLASTTVIPYELEIVADGVFEPTVWKHIYAPLPGEIVEVMAQHQSSVIEGQPLLRMRSRELELKKQELVTQRNVSLEKLRGIEAARLGGRRPQSQPNNAPTSFDLSASERELEELVTSLDKQLSIVDQMLESLVIKSPIQGQVVSWNTASSLERRPVEQGQRLLSLASGDGAGRLQLFVADSDVQHVVRALSQSMADKSLGGVKVTFSVATTPGTKHTARIERIGTIVESSSVDGPRVRTEAQVEPTGPSASLAGTRPGATVVGRIHCGRSNLAYVWLRRLWERWLLWRG